MSGSTSVPNAAAGAPARFTALPAPVSTSGQIKPSTMAIGTVAGLFVRYVTESNVYGFISGLLAGAAAHYASDSSAAAACTAMPKSATPITAENFAAEVQNLTLEVGSYGLDSANKASAHARFDELVIAGRSLFQSGVSLPPAANDELAALRKFLQNGTISAPIYPSLATGLTHAMTYARASKAELLERYEALVKFFHTFKDAPQAAAVKTSLQLAFELLQEDVSNETVLPLLAKQVLSGLKNGNAQNASQLYNRMQAADEAIQLWTNTAAKAQFDVDMRAIFAQLQPAAAAASIQAVTASAAALSVRSAVPVAASSQPALPAPIGAASGSVPRRPTTVRVVPQLPAPIGAGVASPEMSPAPLLPASTVSAANPTNLRLRTASRTAAAAAAAGSPVESPAPFMLLATSTPPSSAVPATRTRASVNTIRSAAPTAGTAVVRADTSVLVNPTAPATALPVGGATASGSSATPSRTRPRSSSDGDRAASPVDLAFSVPAVSTAPSAPSRQPQPPAPGRTATVPAPSRPAPSRPGALSAATVGSTAAPSVQPRQPQPPAPGRTANTGSASGRQVHNGPMGANAPTAPTAPSAPSLPAAASLASGSTARATLYPAFTAPGSVVEAAASGITQQPAPSAARPLTRTAASRALHAPASTAAAAAAAAPRVQDDGYGSDSEVEASGSEEAGAPARAPVTGSASASNPSGSATAPATVVLPAPVRPAPVNANATAPATTAAPALPAPIAASKGIFSKLFGF